MSLSLRKLQYFTLAAESGQMTAAAAALHVSQSSISIGISELERDVGSQLLVRHKSKGLTLTAAGRELLPHARALLARADELVVAARHFGESIGGDFTVGCFTTIAPFVLPELVTQLATTTPPIHLHFREGSQDELQEDLLTGRFELAILYETGIFPGVRCTQLYATRPHVIVPGDHPLAQQHSIALADLADETMIALDVDPSLAYFTGLLRAAGVEPRIRHVTREFEMVRSLVGRGLGYSLLIQKPQVDYSYEGRPVAAMPISDPVDPLPVVLARAEEVQLTRRAQAVASYCEEVLSRTHRLGVGLEMPRESDSK
ncbi:LysR family transcriptional regulator [Nocardia sp. NPDC004068]|uniref:LysR family transcriptional regulator n=1 Tax=Nocardia sp. NPDC004068 TaxID=3364303 RepID=UPI0036B42896